MLDFERRIKRINDLKDKEILTKGQAGFANTMLNCALSLDRNRRSLISTRGWRSEEQNEMMSRISDLLNALDRYIDDQEKIYNSIPR